MLEMVGAVFLTGLLLCPSDTGLVSCILGSALSRLSSMLTVFPLTCNFLDRQHLVATQDLCPCWLKLRSPVIFPSPSFPQFSPLVFSLVSLFQVGG